jgi:prevent-host-death family protein
MDEVTIRDLRNKGGEVVERARRGEALIVTKSGIPVAELHGLRAPLPLEAVLEHWGRLPAVDPDDLRRDIDVVVDPAL